MNKIYVVTMHRWGDTENHSYFLGAYENEEIAIKAEDDERSWRSNKYEGQIIETSIITKSMSLHDDNNKFIKQLPVILNGTIFPSQLMVANNGKRNPDKEQE